MDAKKATKSEGSEAGFFRAGSRDFVFIQFSIVSALGILCLLTYLIADAFGVNTRDLRGIENFLSIFDVRAETSVPTWFSIINLLVSSVLLFCLFVHNKAEGRSNAWYWLCLAVLFLLLSIDESAALHNKATHLAWYTGVPHEALRSHAWLPFGMAFVAVVAVAFVPFLRSIDGRLAALMVLSGAIFVSGAIGFELVASWMEYTSAGERGSLSRNLMVLIEECLEMYGIALFNCVLYRELARQDFHLAVKFQE